MGAEDVRHVAHPTVAQSHIDPSHVGRGEVFDVSVEDWDGLLLSDLGTEEERVVSGSMRSLSEVEGGHIHALIVAAEFSGMEEEAFERRRLTEDTTG